MKSRTASCCCGDLTITVTGEPERVLRCHCDYCQKRTGSVFQVSCWYFADQIVSRTGDPRVFNESAGNQGVNYTFCPRCGSTVYWEFTILPGLYGIAVGCFVETNFPRPNLEIFTRYRHHWIDVLEGVENYEGFPPLERVIPKRLGGIES